MTIVLPATDDAIRQAAQVLRQGGLIGFPTETVYGLGADAEDERAVRAMFVAKGRPADHPVIVHLANSDQLDAWAESIPSAARKLAAAFWPGPLTLILRRSSRASDLVTGGLSTVGLRVPGHPVAQRLLREFGGAIAAPSANRFGRVSPTTAAHVQGELDGRVDIILDGGSCQVGLESTIVDLSGSVPAVLRPGGITQQQVNEVLGASAARAGADAPRVSGSLASHYAPRAAVELVPAEQLAARANALAATGRRVAVLAGSARQDFDACVIVIPQPADDAQLARELYALLRIADAQGCDVVLATLPREDGLGVAIADRLRKAAAPRPEAGPWP